MAYKPKEIPNTPQPPKPIDSGVLRESRGRFRAGNKAGVKHGVYAEYTVLPEEQEQFLEFRQALADQFAEELGVDGILLDMVALQFVHHSRCLRLGQYGAVQLIQPLINHWLDRLKITKKDREHGTKQKRQNILDLFAEIREEDASMAPAAQGADDAGADFGDSDASTAVPPFAPPPPDLDALPTAERIAVIREQVQRDAELKNQKKESHNTSGKKKKTLQMPGLF